MVCSWGAWWHLPVAFFGTLLAILAHELVHYVVMWPVAEEVRLEAADWTLSELRVESDIRDEEWRHRWADAAGYAPLAGGLAVLAVWMQTGLPDPSTMWGLGQWNALLWFGFLGGLSDYSRERSQTPAEDDDIGAALVPDGGEAFVRRNQRLLNLSLIGLLLGALGMVYSSYCLGAVNYWGSWLANAGMGLCSVSIAVILVREGPEQEPL